VGLLAQDFGQGALLLRDPTARRTLFYHLAPRACGLYPLIALATAATITSRRKL